VTTERIIARRDEGVGYEMPGPRHPGHEPVDWYETDYDDQFDDPDTEPEDPLPTERHRTVPGMS
jgi:hypothetical protein